MTHGQAAAAARGPAGVAFTLVCALPLIAVMTVLGLAGCSNQADDLGRAAPAAALRDGQRPQLTHGTMVGGVTSTSATVWFRVQPAADVSVECGLSATLADASVCSDQRVTTQQSSDFTGTVTLSRLKSNTVYHYRVRIDGQPASTKGVARFKTFPLESAEGQAAGRVRVGLLADAICAARAPQLEKLAEDDPDFVVILGDYPHADAVTRGTMRLMRECVRSEESLLGRDFRPHIADRFPIAYIWDDHDC